MSDKLPKYDSPPVVETILGAQFMPLRGFTTAHAGWFWKKHLEESWSSVREVASVEDVYERFGDEVWRPAGRFTVRDSPEANRLQIIRDDGERMIQVQPSRFFYNWRKNGSGEYPSYEKLLPEFQKQFSRFHEFVNAANLESLSLNQWEVTYVNHIPRGELWHEAGDWIGLMRNISFPASDVQGQELDNFNGNWSLSIGQNLGRVHILIKRSRVGSPEGPEVLAVHLTARGPIDLENGVGLMDGFDIGHNAIVLSFTAMTSQEAHKHWKRRV